MKEFDLNKKVAVITGASRGIGLAAAEKLGQCGATCILVSRKKESLDAAAEKLSDQGCKAFAMACHTGDPEKIEAFYNEVNKKFGRLDILVNNAATNPHFGDMLTADAGHWDKTVDVNIKGAFFMIKYGTPLMHNSGSIVNVASVNAVNPPIFQGVYSATKAALINMTKTLAKELAPRSIRVNALLPGLTETRFASALISSKEIYEHIISMVPMGRHAQPEEMAGSILYLASDASSYTTGACLVADGGLLS